MPRGRSENAKSVRTPPYTSYRTFRTFIQDLREHGLPSRVDRSVLTRFSGVVGMQLTHALRFLGLIEEGGRPTQRLRELVDAEDAGRWRETLLDLIRREYAPLFAIDLEVRDALAFPRHLPQGLSGCRRGGAEMRDLLSLRGERRGPDPEPAGPERPEAPVADAPQKTPCCPAAGFRSAPAALAARRVSYRGPETLRDPARAV